MTNKKIIPLLIFTAILFLTGCSKNKIVVNSIYKDDVLMWNHINNVDNPLMFESSPKGVILPHHAIVTRELARFYKGLSKVINPKTIVIIGPDHYETAEGNIITTNNCEFKTVFGNVEADKIMVNKLISSKLASNNDDVFINEHSIYTHAPFIKKYFPQALIVPIIIKWKNPIADNDKLVKWLLENSNDDTFFIASVDFSHYQTGEVSRFHDESSFASITNFDVENIYDLEIDSPPSIYVLLKLMWNLEYKDAKRLLHTNSEDLLKSKQKETTSHQYFSFNKNNNVPLKSITILTAGDIVPTNDKLFIQTKWDWDRTYNPDKDNSIIKYLRNIKGVEDRFFMGSDFYLFDINDGKEHTFSQNGINVCFLKLNENDGSIKGQLKLLAALTSKHDCTVLLYQFDGSKFNSKNERIFLSDAD
jgi:AmmeMemoRadiSam system protein B